MGEDDAAASDSWPAISTGSASVLDDVQQLKGLTFETARRHITAEFGAPVWESLMAALPRHTQALFKEANINDWYPESEMRRFIHVLHDKLAEGNDERFLEIARGLAMAGINRFFRMILNLASAGFVLRKVPVLWTRLRRGPAKLRAEVTNDGRVLIHYEDFRYCRDPLYRLLSIANCQALVLAATDRLPQAEVIDCTRTTMTLSFRLPE
ncbi:MAG: hypothetical protein KC431_20650 [Myxococcales bacterium]|nr:hypothetical protein [Myxococcales bacterium]